MQMIRHAIDRNQFVLIVFHDPGYIFIQISFPFWFNHRSTILNGENELQMNLCVVFAIAKNFQAK